MLQARQVNQFPRAVGLATFALSSVALLLGCSQEPSAVDPATGRVIVVRTPAAVVPPEATFATRTLLAGSVLSARLDTTLDSGSNAEGDTVQATLTSDARDSSGNIALPVGTKLLGRATEVVSARKVKKMSSLAFRFDRAVLPDGTTTDISTGESHDGRGWTKKQGAIIGGSAAGGALVGQVVGHDTKSTVVGAVVGGAIAAGVVMSHVGEDIVLSAGTPVELTLDSDVTVKRPIVGS